MKVRRVKIVNFYSIKDLELEFDNYSNLVLIEGKNLDSGGSNGAGKSVIFEAIVWGLFGRTIRKSLEDAIINTFEKKECSVELWIDDDIKIERSKRPTFLKLYRGDKSLIGSSMNETQKALESLLNTNYKFFIASFVFGQHNEVNFLSCSAEEKRIILRNFLDLDDIFSIRDIVKKRKSEISNFLISNNNYLQKLKEDVLELEKKIKNVSGFDLSKINPELFEQDPKEVLQKEERVRELNKTIEKIKGEVSNLDKIMLGYTSKINEGTKEIKKQCDKCGSFYIVKQSEEDIEKLAYQRQQMEKVYFLKIDEGVRAELELQKIEIPFSSKEIIECLKYKEAYKEIEVLNGLIQNNKEKVDKVEKEIKDKEKSLELLKFWDKALSETGLIKYVVRNILDYFNDRCNFYLHFLTNNIISVEFDEELKETVYIKGEPTYYISLSGGESRKLNLAIMMALQNIVELTQKNQSDIILFDEVAENLDKEAILGLHELFLELTKTKQIFVITHNPYLLDLLDGSDKIKVVKKNGFTSLKG